MRHLHLSAVSHPATSRRSMLQAGSIGLLGLGLSELSRARAFAEHPVVTPTKSVIFVFLTGGISHQDSFDLKPEAPETVRGEFRPIATRTPGIDICEHLPMLAERSDKFALVRSVGTNDSGHEVACHMLLTGRLDLPVGFNVNNVPSPNEWPSIPSQVTYTTRGRNNLPPAIVLPQPSVNEANRVRPVGSGRATKRGTWTSRRNARSETARARTASGLTTITLNMRRRRFSTRRC